MIVSVKQKDPVIILQKISGLTSQVYTEKTTKYEPDFASPLFNNIFIYNLLVDGVEQNSTSLIDKSGNVIGSIELNCSINNNATPVSFSNGSIKFVMNHNVNPESSIKAKLTIDITYIDSNQKITHIEEETIDCVKVPDLIRRPTIKYGIELCGGATRISLFSLSKGRNSKIPATAFYKENGRRSNCVYALMANSSFDAVDTKFTGNASTNPDFSIYFEDFDKPGDAFPVSNLKKNNVINATIKAISSDFRKAFRDAIVNIYNKNKDTVVNGTTMSLGSKPVTILPNSSGLHNNININFDGVGPGANDKILKVYVIEFNLEVINNVSDGELSISIRACNASNVMTTIRMENILTVPIASINHKKMRFSIPVLMSNALVNINSTYVVNGKSNFKFYVSSTSSNQVAVDFNDCITREVSVAEDIYAEVYEMFTRNKNEVNIDGAMHTSTVFNLFTPAFDYGVAIKTNNQDNPYVKADYIELDRKSEFVLVPWIYSKETGLCFETINSVPLTNFFDIKWFTIDGNNKLLKNEGLTSNYTLSDFGKEVTCELVPFYYANE